MSSLSQPKRRRPWTVEEIEIVTKLRERGRGGEFIASALKDQLNSERHPSAVMYQCRRLGINIPAKFRRPLSAYGQRMRGGLVCREWLSSDDATLIALRRDGLGLTEIGRRLNRSATSVNSRLMTLALMDARKEVR